ncbi:MAG: tyrosine-type recombinase/integrase [Chloroflexi bacterium]|nr:tyrosine-type recombinase/integrase [Chloroflexota bacterium]
MRNYHMALASFFAWASREFKIDDPTDRVELPRFQSKPIEPLTKEEVQAMVRACELAKPAETNGRKSFQMVRRTGLRDMAVLLTLLDTGLRVSEICALRIGDVDLDTGQVEIRHGPRGGAKGGKGRVVFLGKEARHYVWRYLASRESKEDLEAPLFAGAWDRPMTQNSLRLLVKSLAAKAGVRNCYPHKFRHTFAITYLRSGGDVFTLQALLGPSSLDMVRHYSMISQVDLATAHRRASPVDNWRL